MFALLSQVLLFQSIAIKIYQFQCFLNGLLKWFFHQLGVYYSVVHQFTSLIRLNGQCFVRSFGEVHLASFVKSVLRLFYLQFVRFVCILSVSSVLRSFRLQFVCFVCSSFVSFVVRSFCLQFISFRLGEKTSCGKAVKRNRKQSQR